MEDWQKKIANAWEILRQAEINKLQNNLSAPRTEQGYYPGRMFDGPSIDMGGAFTNQRPQKLDDQINLNRLYNNLPATWEKK